MNWRNRPWQGAPWEPRKWQREALVAAVALLVERKPTIVQAIMGAGKSILIAELVALAQLEQDEVVVITSPTQKLTEQLAATIRRRCGEFLVGRYYANAKEADRPIISCCMDSAPKLAAVLKEQNRKVALWIADEAHRTESETAQTAADELGAEHRLGLTATPYLDDQSRALSLWQEVAYSYGPSDALRDKVVVPWQVRPWTGRDASVDEACLALIKQHAAGPGVVNAVTIDDAEFYCGVLRGDGIKAMTVHSKLHKDENTRRIRELEIGRIDCLVHVNMLAEGVDFPWLRWLCLRRPVSSRVRFAQEVGRALRAHPGKEYALLLDPMDLFGTFSLTYDAALWDSANHERPAYEDQLVLVEMTAVRFKEGRVVAGTSGVDAKAEVLSATAAYLRQLSLAFQAQGWSEPPGIRSQAWRTDPATQKQLAAVNRLQWARRALGDVMPEMHYKALKLAHNAAVKRQFNKGQVSDLLDVLVTLAKHRTWPQGKVVDQMVEVAA